MKRFLVFVMVFAVAVAPFAFSTTAETIEVNPILRVGLAYGANAPFQARIERYSGGSWTSFEIGYRDGSGNFVAETTTTRPRLYVERSNGSFVIKFTDNAEVVWQYSGSALVIRPVGDGTTSAQTWFAMYRYSGDLEFRQSPDDPSDITVINVLRMQDYLRGVLPYEVSPNWHNEALKAQAVAARNFAYISRGKHSKYSFDVCNTDDCQMYQGMNSAKDSTNRAVDETNGVYLTYNGTIVGCYYHCASGGYTENVENVWPNYLPYVRAVPTLYENLENVPSLIWNYEITTSQMTNILRQKGNNCADIVNVYVEKFTEAGNVYTLTFVDKNGQKWSFSKERARTILGSSYTRSLCFTVEPKDGARAPIYVNQGVQVTESLPGVYIMGQSGKVSISSVSGLTAISASGTESIDLSTIGSVTSDKFVFKGRGQGNNVGMSQYSAKGMAENGYTYKEILEYFFQGTAVTQIQ